VIARRHPGLDAARVYTVLLVAVGHAAISFMVTPIGWAIQDDSQFVGVDLVVWIGVTFAMPLLFWLSGFFSRALLAERGAAGFARQRVTRVLVPLALAIVPCSLALDALWDWARELAGRPEVAENLPRLQGSKLPVTLGHLWFLYYLLVISAIALAIAGGARRRRVAAPRGTGIVAVAAVLAVAPLAVTGVLHVDIPVGFRIDPAVTVYHGAFFAWGWLVRGAPDQLERYATHAWRWGGAAVLLLAALVPALRDAALETAFRRAPLYAIAASAGFTIASVGALLGLCVRYARRSHRLVELASQASYWFYITHLPVVVLLQIAFARVAWPGVVKYLAIVAITAIVCFGSFVPLRWAYARRRSRMARSTPPDDK
jgi:glucans biosynthesis protein C